MGHHDAQVGAESEPAKVPGVVQVRCGAQRGASDEGDVGQERESYRPGLPSWSRGGAASGDQRHEQEVLSAVCDRHPADGGVWGCENESRQYGSSSHWNCAGLVAAAAELAITIRLTGTHTHLTGCRAAYPRTAGRVNSQAVEATWTDDPVNNSHDSARAGPAPAGGARITALTSAAAVSMAVAQSQAREAFTPPCYFVIRCIGNRYYVRR
jgi:hypothetical protein